MPQIKFTVSDEAVAYLRWLAKHVLSEKNEHDAARHLMMRQFEKTRRKDRPGGPTSDEIKAFLPAAEEPEAATSPAKSPDRK